MDKKQIIGKWFGPYKIEDAFGDEQKTYLGDECINIVLDNGKTEFLPEKTLEAVITDEKSDFTTQQNKLFDIVIPQIITIMVEYDLSMFDIANLIGKIDMSVNENWSKAIAKIFNKNDKSKITLMQLHKILKEDKK